MYRCQVVSIYTKDLIADKWEFLSYIYIFYYFFYRTLTSSDYYPNYKRDLHPLDNILQWKVLVICGCQPPPPPPCSSTFSGPEDKLDMPLFCKHANFEGKIKLIITCLLFTIEESDNLLARKYVNICRDVPRHSFQWKLPLSLKDDFRSPNRD